jgi:N-acetylglucosaminyl-diphospho-decaprenol L-rhamnosyltransferase
MTVNQVLDSNIDLSKDIPVDMSIVLVGWNNKAYLEPCLDSLYNGNLKSSFDVVVVDNGSTDGSQEMLHANYPEVMIIQNEKNEGLGKASNQGIVATKGKYVLLLNNDTIVNGPSFDLMVNYLDNHPKVGAVGGKLLNEDGSTQACYNKFSSLSEEFLIATRLGELFSRGYPAIMEAEDIKSVDWIGSACLLIRRSALDQVGLLDEEYFIYGDEADIQYRLKKAGWEIVFLPQATTIHFGGRSMTRWPRRKRVYRGKMLFYKKNYGIVRLFLLRLMLAILSVFKILVWGFLYLIPNKREQAKGELRSNFDVIEICFHLE